MWLDMVTEPAEMLLSLQPSQEDIGEEEARESNADSQKH